MIRKNTLMWRLRIRLAHWLVGDFQCLPHNVVNGSTYTTSTTGASTYEIRGDFLDARNRK